MDKKLNEENTIGSTLLLIRKKLGMTQEELGKEIGMTESSISRVAKSKDSEISIKMSYKLYLFAQKILGKIILKNYLGKEALHLRNKCRSNIYQKSKK